MPIIAGQDSKFQIGLGSTWGTTAAPTDAIAFTSEDLVLEPGYITEDALVGKKTDGAMNVSSKKVTGGWNQIAHAADIGLAIAVAMGSETAPADSGDTNGSGDTIYNHVFVPLAGGTASSLPGLTAVVDRKIDTFGYISCKVNTMTFDSSPRDYLRARFDVLGYDEDDGDTIDASLDAPDTEAFLFDQATVSIGTDASEVVQIDVTNISLTYSNTLEDDLFTTGSDTNMAEIEPQKREITVSFDVLYTALTDTVRSTYFKTGDPASCIITFVTANNYSLTFDMPLCYVTEASPVVAGPERLTQTLELKATESSALEALTVTLGDTRTTAYLS